MNVQLCFPSFLSILLVFALLFGLSLSLCSFRSLSVAVLVGFWVGWGLGWGLGWASGELLVGFWWALGLLGLLGLLSLLGLLFFWGLGGVLVGCWWALGLGEGFFLVAALARAGAFLVLDALGGRTTLVFSWALLSGRVA